MKVFAVLFNVTSECFLGLPLGAGPAVWAASCEREENMLPAFIQQTLCFPEKTSHPDYWEVKLSLKH